MGQNYYEILGISKDAGQQEIRQAYRMLAKQWHPDKNQSTEAHQRFAEINQAHETLSDPLKRKLYDLRQQVGHVFSGPMPWTARRKPSPEEQRRQYWQSEAGQRRKKELEREAVIFSRINRVLKFVAIISLAMGLLLVSEKYLASSHGPQKVIEVKISLDDIKSANVHGAVVIITANDQFDMDLTLSQCIQVGDTLSIYRSPLLGLITQIETPGLCKISGSNKFDPRNGLFAGTFMLVYFILVISLSVILIQDKFVKVGLGVLNLLFFLVILALVIQNL